ncbi:hypothetical protein B0T17DRAFT_89206 [Bombardia bombarda]|uniref:Uncharacterized protein n=1 Tax=Bombardia bombarda TaxID=252184 RepID=A0AA39XMG2_9PEZI|nr:hypothetical protein B0T17DRAFT_89206 [Bombardia bombarda]
MLDKAKENQQILPTRQCGPTTTCAHAPCFNLLAAGQRQQHTGLSTDTHPSNPLLSRIRASFTPPPQRKRYSSFLIPDTKESWGGHLIMWKHTVCPRTYVPVRRLLLQLLWLLLSLLPEQMKPTCREEYPRSSLRLWFRSRHTDDLGGVLGHLHGLVDLDMQLGSSGRHLFLAPLQLSLDPAAEVLQLPEDLARRRLGALVARVLGLLGGGVERGVAGLLALAIQDGGSDEGGTALVGEAEVLEGLEGRRGRSRVLGLERGGVAGGVGGFGGWGWLG